MKHTNPEQAFVEELSSFTARLIRNAATFGTEGSIGSGVLLQRPAGIALVTAGHNYEKAGTWTLETAIQKDGLTLTLPIPNPQRLLTVDLTEGKAEPLDIAWSWIHPTPEVSRSEGVDNQREIPLNVYLGPIDRDPESANSYAFAAGSRVFLDANLGHLVVETAFELGMGFLGTNARGLHEFALARPHQGHEFYSGASGAPIIDEATGAIVSILVGGLAEENVLLGFPLATVAGLIDETGAAL